MRGSGQLNLDGQQVTTAIVSETGDGQPSFSKDSIAEFQFITNRFDATQGRSTEMQVNVDHQIRHQRVRGLRRRVFQARPVQCRGPRRGSRSSRTRTSSSAAPSAARSCGTRSTSSPTTSTEREPKTKVHTTPWPAFNLSFFPTDTVHIAGVRTDSQFTPRTRLTLRYNDYDRSNPHVNVGWEQPSLHQRGAGLFTVLRCMAT